MFLVGVFNSDTVSEKGWPQWQEGLRNSFMLWDDERASSETSCFVFQFLFSWIETTTFLFNRRPFSRSQHVGNVHREWVTTWYSLLNMGGAWTHLGIFSIHLTSWLKSYWAECSRAHCEIGCFVLYYRSFIILHHPAPWTWRLRERAMDRMRFLFTNIIYVCMIWKCTISIWGTSIF